MYFPTSAFFFSQGFGIHLNV